MKEPSLPVTAFFSFLLHATFIFTALITIKNANRFTMPSPYIVSLVSSEVSELPAQGKEGTALQIEEPEQKMKLPLESSKNKASEDAKQYISDRIAALEATRKAKRIVKLRNIISIGGSGPLQAETDTAEPAQSLTGDTRADTLLKSYSEKIQHRIEQHWAFPTTWGKNLQAVVSIVVMSDGTAKINRLEKSSGNIFFDRSVINAVYKASPFAPPPYEMEIELNFAPKGKK